MVGEFKLFPTAINAVNKADLYRYLTKPWEEEDFLLTVEKGIQQYYLVDETVQQLEMFRKFVPREFLEKLGREHIVEVKLGDQIQQEMTIMFTDIRDFTSLSEQMTPKENFDFINAYLKRMGPIIRNHDGIIDKFLGDGIMALFPETSESALKSALEMHKVVVQYNVQRISEGFKPIKIGIGLHKGKLMLGTIGDKERMQSTVISDSVNVASRVENLTKYYSSGTLITEEAFSTLPKQHLEQYNYRLLGKIKVKGKATPLSVYDFFDSDETSICELKKATLSDYNSGLEHFYNQQFKEAAKEFGKVILANEKDKAARHYFETSSNLEVTNLPENWDIIDLVGFK